MAALLGEVGDTGVEFEIAVILEGLCQADELRGERKKGGVGTRACLYATAAQFLTLTATEETKEPRSSSRLVPERLCLQWGAHLLLGDLLL